MCSYVSMKAIESCWFNVLFIVAGVCAPGYGFGVDGVKKCSECPVNTYNNDAGGICTPCERGYGTVDMTAATLCRSKHH